MFREGDRILMGVSGGPDSLALLSLLHEGSLGLPRPGALIALHVDLGFSQAPPQNREQLEQYFRSRSIEYRIVQTEISGKALDPNARKNPCFICSMYRRRVVYETAHREGCTKIAYGHHKDDLIETLLINILYGRKIEAMNPVQNVFRGKMHIIRPLVYIWEEELKQYALEQSFPVLPRLCPMDGKSRRHKIKKMIRTLQEGEKNANIRENIFKSLKHVNVDPIFRGRFSNE
jgi:tRNA 2-thiocytidine biosynthesis protein TtcA